MHPLGLPKDPEECIGLCRVCASSLKFGKPSFLELDMTIRSTKATLCPFKLLFKKYQCRFGYQLPQSPNVKRLSQASTPSSHNPRAVISNPMDITIPAEM